MKHGVQLNTITPWDPVGHGEAQVLLVDDFEHPQDFTRSSAQNRAHQDAASAGATTWSHAPFGYPLVR